MAGNARLTALLVAALFVLTGFSGCLSSDDESHLILATTTSMRDSGLLDILLPEFTEQTGIEVDVVAVGTGAALNLGRAGDADVLIVHAPEAELEFVEQGYADERITFAWNTFVVLGPQKLEGNITEVLSQIVDDELCFLSRGDNSGTHMREQILWEYWADQTNNSLIEDEFGTHPDGEWYESIGQGMGATITMADERECVTLADRGTALFRADNTNLQMMNFSDPPLINTYSIIPLLAGDTQAGQALAEFLTNQAVEMIDSYEISGQKLFNSGLPPA